MRIRGLFSGAGICKEENQLHVRAEQRPPAHGDAKVVPAVLENGQSRKATDAELLHGAHGGNAVPGPVACKSEFCRNASDIYYVCFCNFFIVIVLCRYCFRLP